MTYKDKGSYESSPPCTQSLMCTCDMTHSTHVYSWYDSFNSCVLVKWLIQLMRTREMTHSTHAYSWNDSFNSCVLVIWLIQLMCTRDMTHSTHVTNSTEWNDWCEMAHLPGQKNPCIIRYRFTCATFHVCDMPHSYVQYGSLTCVICRIRTWVMSHAWDTHAWVMSHM